jgi:hypothetical protein
MSQQSTEFSKKSRNLIGNLPRHYRGPSSNTNQALNHGTNISNLPRHGSPSPTKESNVFDRMRDRDRNHTGNKDLESLENQTSSPEINRVGAVYKFKPTTECPRIRLLSSPTNSQEQVTLKHVVKMTAILIVTEKKGDWWLCMSGGYQGWANITQVMIDTGLLKPLNELRRYEDWRGTLSADWN